jgi:transcriptional regulator with XRE-family HTH domain
MSELEKKSRTRLNSRLPKESAAQLGSAKLVGTVLRINRSMHNKSQEERAELAGVHPSLISRIELGKQIPSRLALADLLNKWNLPEAQRDEMMIYAGYIPELEGLSIADIPILVGALRELLRPAAHQGYIKMLQDQIARLPDNS